MKHDFEGNKMDIVKPVRRLWQLPEPCRRDTKNGTRVEIFRK